MNKIKNFILAGIIIATMGVLFLIPKPEPLAQRMDLSSENEGSSLMKSQGNQITEIKNPDPQKDSQRQTKAESQQSSMKFEGPAFDALMSVLKTKQSNEFWDLNGFQAGQGQWMISGTGIKISEDNPKTQIHLLATQVTESLGSNQNPLADIDDPIQTDDLSTYTVHFAFEGVKVRESILKVMVDSESGIVNFLQMDSVPITTVKNSIRLASSDVESALKDKIKNQVGAIQVIPTPMLDVNEKGEGRNIWIAIAETSNPKDKRQYFIDAETGLIVHSNSVLIKD